MPVSASDLLQKGILASSRPVAASGISFVSSNSGFVPSGTSIPLDLQTHAANDFAFVFAYGDRGSANISISGTTGWTELFDESHNTGRLRRSAGFYKVLTSASEANPTVSFAAADFWSASITVFRGVDAVTPLDAVHGASSGANNLTPSAPAVTSVSTGACVFTMCGLTHAEITAIGAPAGYTLSQSVVSSDQGAVHFNQGTAYLLNAGPAGLKSPGNWNNSGNLSTTDYSAYTVALRPA